MKGRIGLIIKYINRQGINSLSNSISPLKRTKMPDVVTKSSSKMLVKSRFQPTLAIRQRIYSLAVVRRITAFAITIFLVIINSNSPVSGIGIKGENLPQPIANGQIIQTTGDVGIQRNGHTIHPKIGTIIYPGDKLLTANESQIIVQCANLSTQSISAGKNQANTCPSETEETCTPGTYKCPHRGEITWKSNIPYIISPRRTAILNDKPILRWNPVPGAKVYTVNVEGKGVKWTTKVGDTQIIYPGEPPLKPDTPYLLTVEADTGVSSLDEPVSVGGINFTLLEAQKAQEIRTQSAQIAQQSWNEEAKAIAVANLYSKNSLNGEAIATLESSGIHTAPIYRQIGHRYFYYLALIPQAKEYYTKAITIADSEDIEEQTQIQYSLGKVEVALGNKDEAVRWFTLALKGYQMLGYSEQIDEVERQLRGVNSDGK
ncbi:hypothetical protein [Limnofasciculus baicalensis]|uniref:Tetratricopeptide repeat protein n=1 Tax=Limnofasciculus baicalensis BBK-W-15 TaxID=2699891 RepID=A0AAE3KPU6_9CYAN|nr:hypothetical protein [Limnofasciculus baicalensis]MCP2730033.1 hypothetical protein [Limnofasciculus baicalensis BBK-W-15]